MRKNKEDAVKGVLPKLLVWLGVELTEKNLLRARVTIVLVCVVGMIHFYGPGGDVGDKYGNYDEIKSQLP